MVFRPFISKMNVGTAISSSCVVPFHNMTRSPAILSRIAWRRHSGRVLLSGAVTMETWGTPLMSTDVSSEHACWDLIMRGEGSPRTCSLKGVLGAGLTSHNLPSCLFLFEYVYINGLSNKSIGASSLSCYFLSRPFGCHTCELIGRTSKYYVYLECDVT